MKVFICDHCGCEIKYKKPEECPLCRNKKAEFTETEFPEPDKAEQISSKKYKEALETLDEYEKGCDPQSIKYAFEE